MTKAVVAVLACVTVGLSASSAEKESKWISLFNGKDLTFVTPIGFGPGMG